jgi:pectate lyase
MRTAYAPRGAIGCPVVVILCCFPLVASAAGDSGIKAFPTAEGFGAAAAGGRGGRVIEVTTLDDAGPGSLRAAMEAARPRICVFRVSGTITLKSAIQVRQPYLTVAGQTSPGGVQIRGDGNPAGDWGVWFVNGAHDIVIRHLRVRMGGNHKHDAGNNILCYGTAEPGVHDVIVDHCSVAWGADTQLTGTGPSSTGPRFSGT